MRNKDVFPLAMLLKYNYRTCFHQHLLKMSVGHSNHDSVIHHYQTLKTEIEALIKRVGNKCRQMITEKAILPFVSLIDGE